MTRNWVRAILSGVAISAATAMLTVSASAATLFGAMEKAYVTNPTINAARAGQRATDELVPQALSGWRPTIGVTGEVADVTTTQRVIVPQAGGGTSDRLVSNNSPAGTVNIQLDQP